MDVSSRHQFDGDWAFEVVLKLRGVELTSDPTL